MFEKIKIRRLCSIISKEIESKGYCAWPITGSLYNIGVTLSDNINRSVEEMNNFKNAINELSEKYKGRATISCTEPTFSAGGVYASRLSVRLAGK